VAQRVGSGRCRFARRDGSLGAARSCSEPLYLTAKRGRKGIDGKVSWSLRIGQLREGSYVAKVRGRDAAGNVERPFRRTNRAEFTVG
jgi:hypothetical protein